MKKRRALALTMAAVTALTSTSICAYAEGQDSKALASAITVAKTRLDIPEELSEFSYYTINSDLKNTYVLTWHTPDGAEEYREVSATVCGNLIIRYDSSDMGYSNSEKMLAKLSGDELFQKAQECIKKINPSVVGVIRLDRDSLSISTYCDRAYISFVRTKNGVPVENDSGSIVVNKNTGELISFNMNWHENASFKDAKNAISVEKAMEKYEQMINIQPHYEFYYDWDSNELKSRLVYSQSDYGEINAFTGKKSNFEADGYFDKNSNAIFDDAECATEENGGIAGGYDFTEQEQAELDKDLPYAGEAAVVKMLQNDPYLTYKTDMELSYSALYRVTFGDKVKYYYSATLTNDDWGYEWEEPQPIYEDWSIDSAAADEVLIAEPIEIKPSQTVNITVDAESGQILSYSLYDSEQETAASYDMAKADKLAEDIAKKYAGDMYGEFGDYSSYVNSWTDDSEKEHFWGSSHGWVRFANDIPVSGDGINISLSADMKLTNYDCNYTDIELPDPAKMLTAKQVMNKFWKDHDLDLYYLARLNKKVTKTVLVYGADDTVYADAFTGEQIYGGYKAQENDLSGIKDKNILKMAQKLDDHGFMISENKFSEKDSVTAEMFEGLMGAGSFGDENDGGRKLTRGEALVIFTKSVCGDVVPELKGIYKSPFKDVKDTDKNVGYYAIAYGMGVVSGDKLDPKADFTMGDMIKMVYKLYSQQ